LQQNLQKKEMPKEEKGMMAGCLEYLQFRLNPENQSLCSDGKSSSGYAQKAKNGAKDDGLKLTRNERIKVAKTKRNHAQRGEE
jgi:hypothetical protein